MRGEEGVRGSSETSFDSAGMEVWVKMGQLKQESGRMVISERRQEDGWVCFYLCVGKWGK